MRKLLISTALPIAALGLMAAGPDGRLSTSATMVITSNAGAELCARHARAVADGMMAPQTAVQTCTTALDAESLDRRDRAATRNNRGVIYLTMSDLTEAASDFEAAAAEEPLLGESWVNRGSALVQMGQDKEAVAAIEKGLALNPAEPWRAYFNRGVARENLGDIRGAFADYTKAAELNPTWEPPKTELARFSVKKP